jgi:Uma2 family endonuclease
MVSAGQIPPGEIVATADQRVILHNVRWDQFEAMVAFRGDAPTPRYAYSKGTLEIMNPSRSHETIKGYVGRLLETYAIEIGVEFTTVGSWLLKNAPTERGLEPDECYLIGDPNKDRPDLAIEVVWTSGGIDKLEIYRYLGVGEVWIVAEGRIEVHVLQGEHYVEAPESHLFPDLDLALIMRLAGEPTTSAAVRKLRDSLRADSG